MAVASTTTTTTTARTPKPIITDLTYLELVNLISNSGLTDGLQYQITDFKTVHYILSSNDTKFGINTGELEPLLLTATSNHTLDKEAKSSLYSEDIIYYDWNPTNWLNDSSFSDTEDTSTIIISGFTGVIYFRHDTLLDNYMGYDFRNVKFRRWELLVPEWNINSGYTESDFVIYQSYICKSLISNSGQTPSQNSDYWTPLFDLSLTTYWSTNESEFNGVQVNTNTFGDFKTFHEITGTTATYQKCCRSNHFESFKDDYYDDYITRTLLSNNVFFLQDTNVYTIYSNQIGSQFSYNTIGGIGEYVIANGENYTQYIQEFFLTNIGKIRRSDPKSLDPDDPDNEFEVEIYDDSGVFVVDYENKIPWGDIYNTSKLHNYTVLFYGTDILYHSKSKNNCELFIQAKKYNL